MNTMEMLPGIITIATMLLFLVLGVIGVIMGWKQKIVVYTTRKDMLVSPIGTAIAVGLVLLIITIPVSILIILGLFIYNIVIAVKNNKTKQGKIFSFFARSLLSTIATFLLLTLFQGKHPEESTANYVVGKTIWAAIGFWVYKQMSHFIKEEQVAKIKVA